MAPVQQEQGSAAECGENGELDMENDEHEPEEEGDGTSQVRTFPFRNSCFVP